MLVTSEHGGCDHGESCGHPGQLRGSPVAPAALDPCVGQAQATLLALSGDSGCGWEPGLPGSWTTLLDVFPGCPICHGDPCRSPWGECYVYVPGVRLGTLP